MLVRFSGFGFGGGRLVARCNFCNFICVSWILDPGSWILDPGSWIGSIAVLTISYAFVSLLLFFWRKNWLIRGRAWICVFVICSFKWILSGMF